MKPRLSSLDRSVSTQLAATEYDRCATLLCSLDDPAWAEPTDCAGWDVRAMAAHMLGMVEMAASMRDGMRQQRAASKDGGFHIDRLTALQVAERASWSGTRVADRYAERWPKAARARRRVPGLMRRRPVPSGVINGVEEPWTMGYMLDVILTRDQWMHRMDISRALDRVPNVTADHDGVLVADVVEEWAQRHGKDFTLQLGGPAGGTWAVGSGDPLIELDAVEFCRVLSGRAGHLPLSELMGTEVPF